MHIRQVNTKMTSRKARERGTGRKIKKNAEGTTKKENTFLTGKKEEMNPPLQGQIVVDVHYRRVHNTVKKNGAITELIRVTTTMSVRHECKMVS